MQTKRQSMIEVITNVATGYMISMGLTLYALPLWGLSPTLTDALGMSVLYTAAAIARGFVIRRWFNA